MLLTIIYSVAYVIFVQCSPQMQLRFIKLRYLCLINELFYISIRMTDAQIFSRQNYIKKPGKVPWKKIGMILARSSYIPFELFVAKSTENLAFFDEILFVQKICLRGKKRRAALAEVFSRIRGTSAVQKKLGNFPARDDCNYSKRRSVEFEHRLSAPDGRCNDSDKSF